MDVRRCRRQRTLGAVDVGALGARTAVGRAGPGAGARFRRRNVAAEAVGIALAIDHVMPRL